MNEEEAIKRLSGLEKMEQPSRERPSYPKGWEPGLTWEGDKGVITSSTLTEPPTDWSDILRERGLDPERYDIVGDTIRWTSYDGWKRDNPDDPAYSAICYSYKAEIRLKNPLAATIDCEALYKEIRKAKPKKRNEEGDSTLVIALSDWQIGNGDQGGVEAQMLALADLPDLATKRIKDLRKVGNKVERVLIAGLGDLGEGTCGFYPSQPFLTQFDRRTQTRVVRRALVDIIQAVADTTTEVLVTAVGGNHGENRDGGKRITGFADNDDVAVFEQVAEIFGASSYDNIAFRLPNDELGIAIDLHGQIVALTHGHLPKPGKNAAEALWGWWTEHAMGRFYPGVADANILISGHFHHLNVKQQAGRTVFICPSLTPVGDWFSSAKGVQTVPGTLSLLVNETGWSHMEVLR